MTSANHAYQNLLGDLLRYGDTVHTRNSETLSIVDSMPVIFDTVPLITIRKTAWKMALKEMAWFMSGQSKCPDELLSWWDGQLNPDGHYLNGYATQMRNQDIGLSFAFDQIQFLLEGLRNNPNSRRLVMSLWNGYEMAMITEVNQNPHCPTVCHSTLVQLFVRNGRLYMTSYQRSADVLLGAPHNFCQTWALLLWFAHHSNLRVGTLRWVFGDLHLYSEPSHIKAAKEIVLAVPFETNLEMQYNYSGGTDDHGVPLFKAEDFSIVGEIPLPLVTTKPKLLI